MGGFLSQEGGGGQRRFDICKKSVFFFKGFLSLECSCVISLKPIELNLNDFASNFRFLVR